MTTREENYIEFYSPGTFFTENSRRGPIESWSIPLACEMANGVTERYNAKPFGFRFITLLVSDPIPDGRGGEMKVEAKELKRSPIHYLGGNVIRYDDIPDDREHSILRSNMRCNDWPLVIENTNSWKYTGAFHDGEVIVDADGSILRSAGDADLLEYKNLKLREFKEERGY